MVDFSVVNEQKRSDLSGPVSESLITLFSLFSLPFVRVEGGGEESTIVKNRGGFA